MKRDAPLILSMPTQAKNSPIVVDSSAFVSDLVPMLDTQEMPRKPSAKYSAGPKRSANSASVGASVCRMAVLNSPPRAEHIIAVPSALPA